jgi:methionine synthase II (cobalamin-independent)
MPIPTEMVGSLPRPMKLQEAYQAYDDGKIDWEQLKAEQDEAAEDSIRRLEATGVDVVTDGEQRESSFATYPITDTLAGTGLADNLAGDGQFFAIFDDGHHRQLPRLTGGPFRYKTYASEFVEKNKKIATRDVKQAVIAPSMLMLLYPLEEEIEGYGASSSSPTSATKSRRTSASASPRRGARLDRLHRGPAREQERLAQPVDRQGHAAGVHRPQQPGHRPLLAEERRTSASTPAPAATCDSVHSKEVPYEKLLSKMFQLNAGYFLIQCASEDDKETVYKLCAQYSREDADGVPQVCFMGVINPLDPEVETPSRCATTSDRGQAHPGRAPRATDDCGFTPFSRDEKPKHGSPGLRARHRDAEDRRPSGGRAARFRGARRLAGVHLGTVGEDDGRAGDGGQRPQQAVVAH